MNISSTYTRVPSACPQVILLLMLICGFLVPVSAQNLVKDWDRDYGGNLWEECNAVANTNDGGYIIGGYTSTSANGDVSGATTDLFPPPDVGDFWVVKTDANGNLEWENRYGGDRLDRLWSIEQTTDDGYIMGGWSRSNISGNKSEDSYGDLDYWIVKIDQSGAYQWDRTFGGDSLDQFQTMIQTSDGGYLIGGMSLSDIGPIKTESRRGHFDLWFVKIDAAGTLEWEKTLGGVEEERLNEIHEAPDGNFIVGGSTDSPVDGMDVNQAQIGGKDFWFLKISSTDGTIMWEERYGGTDEDEIQSLVLTSDGGYLLVGGSRSPANPPHKTDPSLALDIWALKLDASRAYEWNLTLGGDQFENCYSAKENTVGHYILGGFSQSGISGTKTSAPKGAVGSADFWLNYISPAGNLLWDLTVGGTEQDVMEDIFQTPDGGYILAGHSSSNIGADKSEDSKGLNDFWIVKTLCNIDINFNDTTVCPNMDVVLDAYDPNCIDCQWQWDDLSTDSVRMININSQSNYSVTLTDGVGCSYSDEILVDLHSIAPIDLPATVGICQGDSVSIGVSEVSTSSYEWSNGVFTSQQDILADGVYSLTITDANNCVTSDSIEAIVHAIPIVNIGADTAICEGESITLDAGNPGASYNWFPLGNTQSITITPIGPITVGVQVTDGNNCVGAHQLNITELYEIPSVQNLTIDCDEDNNSYSLSFEVADPTGIDVVGLSGGTWNGNTYTVDGIASGDAYDFYLENTFGCTSVTLQDNYSCVCTSNSGSIVDTQIDICEGETYFLPIMDLVTDSDDVFEILIHDGDANTIGNVLHQYVSNAISYVPALNFNQQYYVTIVVGNETTNGSVNMNDGCLSIAEGVPITFGTAPQSVIDPIGSLTLDCDNTSVVLTANNSVGSTALQYSWMGPGSIMNPNDPMIEVSDSGTYVLQIEDALGCTDEESIVVELLEGTPNIILNGPLSLNCETASVDISAAGSSVGAEYEWEWTGQGINGTQSENVNIENPGTYSLSILNTMTNCLETEEFTVVIDSIAPSVVTSSSYYLDCIAQEASLALNIQNCQNCNIDWTSSDGNFLDMSNPQEPIVDQVGAYDYTISNLDNGCFTNGSLQVMQSPDGPQSMELSLTNPGCNTSTVGAAIVEGVAGGQEPLSFSLNGGTPSTSSVFSNLNPGQYTIQVIDDLGCSISESFSIQDTPVPFLELGDDITITIGEEVTLDPIFIDLLSELNWNSEVPLDCESCENPSLSPTEQTTVALEIVTQDGCVATDRITIFVDQNVPYFVPNAFSPNGDGNNDEFKPFFDEKGLEQILSFRVFNRWGELVYLEEPIEGMVDLKGWDGKFRNRTLNPDVFVYVIEVIFKPNRKRIIKGDVTLLR